MVWAIITAIGLVLLGIRLVAGPQANGLIFLALLGVTLGSGIWFVAQMLGLPRRK